MTPNNRCPVCCTLIDPNGIDTSKGFESAGETLCVLHTCPTCGAEMEAWFDLRDNEFLGLEID